jgi:hypothetical protein
VRVRCDGEGEGEANGLVALSPGVAKNEYAMKVSDKMSPNAMSREIREPAETVATLDPEAPVNFAYLGAGSPQL